MTGKELAMLRRRAGLSQAALAQSIGVSRQTVSYWERNPTLDGRTETLGRIAGALDPADRELLLSSRPGLGFITLRFMSPISPEQINLIIKAEAQRGSVPCGGVGGRARSLRRSAARGRG